MKALVFYGTGDIRLEPDWPEPDPAPGEVKLRMTCTSICASDIERWQHGSGSVGRVCAVNSG